ncbi:hypothetical protein IFM51744_07155 [Aspergillus udagawae]|uniref:Uncharacterized protein n=1 Tax=Aspergillus udagawae TaxID=91492 RepID=A0A8E0QME1_9EURO|nr:uncharacterized protein Aud_003474 [Aspergillus udagawae]GFF36861.1 hypothetical protein IFM46972_05030 [Aspergillus udagawae]GFF49718.1 hypothetical protein IFM51744_07155 [Aspergillus udagawae]GIC87093.1 hypothetical protein Aud_003474 [Aspergillus udagawae]
MAHNGIARSQRLTRLMKQKHRTRHEGVEPASKPGEESAGSLISSIQKAHVLDHSKRHESSGEVSHKDSDHSLEKRQDPSAVPPESQTAAPATTVTSVVDASPDTAAALPTSISDPASSQPTVSVPVENPPAAVPSTTSLNEIPTPSPGPISFTADTSAITSANDLTTIPTAYVSLSLDLSLSISVSVPTSIAIINSASSTQSSALIPSARSSSAVLSSTPISSPKPTSTSTISSSTYTNGTNSYGSYDSTSSDYSGEYSTTSVSEATTTADLYSTGTYFGGGDSGATATGQAPSATTSSSSGGGLDSVTTKRIVGGVVGGLAGAFFLLGLLLFLLRRRKTALFRPNRGLPASDGTGGTTGERGSVSRTEMASRRSSRDPLFTASYFAPAFMKRWRQSNQTVRSDDSTFTSTTTSERGFQKISGRKIPSVLQSGGDGYGGGFDQGSPTASEPSMSLPPGSPVQPRSVISQPPPSMPYGMPLDVSYTREADEAESVVVFRPSPARTPVASSTNVSVVNVPAASRAIPQPGVTLSPTIPQRPDGLGRSHPSFDGSRGSRFTESLDGL